MPAGLVPLGMWALVQEWRDKGLLPALPFTKPESVNDNRSSGQQLSHKLEFCSGCGRVFANCSCGDD